MKNLQLTNFIAKKHINKKINKHYLKKFETIYKSFCQSFDTKKITSHIFSKKFSPSFNLSQLRKYSNYKKIVIIGMGGSILGSEAIFNFFQEKIRKEVYFLNNLDLKKVKHLQKKINFNKTLFLVISKSGNTIETLSNLFSLNIIKKNKKNVIVISENSNNILKKISEKFNLFFVEHKNYIGGRYSILSEVGLIPAFFMGLNISRFRKDIRKHLFGKEKKFFKETVIKLTNIFNQKKINNLIFINYSPRLDKFLYWTQQLIAESLGKSGKGFLPVVSTAPKDHHSLLQLYLDGPKDKLFYIFSNEEKLISKLSVKKYTNQINFIHNKTINEIKETQKNALIKSFKKKGIPFREFKLNKINEQLLGELFSYFMMETIFIGKLSNINPFDQPAVEQVKIFTKKILK